MVDFTVDVKTTDNDELLAAAKAGCADSINAVLSRCRGHIYSLVARYLGKRIRSIDAQGVTQDVQYSVYVDLPKCRAATWQDFLYYLVTVTRNRTLKEIERADAKKRGGGGVIKIESLGDFDHVALQSDDIAEASDLDELIAKLETITSLHPDHAAVLRSYVSSVDAPKRCQIDSLALETGKPRQQCYRAVKRFKSDARAIVMERFDSELVEAVKDDLMTGQCRRSMKSCYGLLPSELDAIEVS